MTDLEIVRLTDCDHIVDAHFIKNKLNNEGIECFLTNENITNLLPMYNNMLGSGIQIFVFEKDLPRAQELVRDYKELKTQKISCPHCGSTKIGMGKGFRKFVNILISMAAMVPFTNPHPRYYCKQCGREVVEAEDRVTTGDSGSSPE